MPHYPDNDAEYVEKTPEGLVAWFNDMDHEQQTQFMVASERDMMEAHRCLIENHAGRLAQIPKMHEALNKRESLITELRATIAGVEWLAAQWAQSPILADETAMLRKALDERCSDPAIVTQDMLEDHLDPIDVARSRLDKAQSNCCSSGCAEAPQDCIALHPDGCDCKRCP